MKKLYVCKTWCPATQSWITSCQYEFDDCIKHKRELQAAGLTVYIERADGSVPEY